MLGKMGYKITRKIIEYVRDLKISNLVNEIRKRVESCGNDLSSTILLIFTLAHLNLGSVIHQPIDNLLIMLYRVYMCPLAYFMFLQRLEKPFEFMLNCFRSNCNRALPTQMMTMAWMAIMVKKIKAIALNCIKELRRVIHLKMRSIAIFI